MIKPNELRLGNYVKYPFHELQVCQLFVDSFQGMYVGGKGCYMYESCEGIPLTSERLLKFGFRRMNNAYVSPHKNDFSLWNPKGEEEITFNDTVMCPRIDYVHQLQNLYFALTGEELTIQE